MASKTTAIGIDLGTTFSCAGVLTKGGRVDIIVNDLGHPTTPSAVCFNDDERLIGKAAMDKLKSTGTCNTVYGVKRIIGRLFDEPSVQRDIQQWPFTVVAGAGKQPRVEVQYNGETKKFDIEEISEMVLGKLKESAEEFLGHEVKDAVITVPAYFNDSQRQATKVAGTIAGFNVLQVLNEPTAAAIAYGFKNPAAGKRTLLVFDLGGGTFDVSILEVDGGNFDVRAVAGDTHLGGEDFDERMVQHCVAEFKKQSGKDISTNKKAVSRLRAACVEVKHQLSSGVQANIEVAALADGINFTTTMTRACFEATCEDLFEKTVDEVKKALKDAKLEKSDIDEVVLVGGSTRIPKVRQLLTKFFDGKDLKKTINPDEAVACGAAILAAQLSGDASKQDDLVGDSNVRLRDLALSDVTPLSLGLETVSGAMCTLIPRNSKISVKETRECTTDQDHETYIVIKIYEGERALAKDNHFLASLTMSGFQSAKASGGSWPMIEVTFEIDTNGILHVSAKDHATGESTEVTVDGRGKLPKAEIDRMIRDAEVHKAQDAVVRAKLLAKDNLDRLVRKIQRSLAASPGSVPVSAEQNVHNKCTEAERVLNDASKDELERLYADLHVMWKPIAGYY